MIFSTKNNAINGGKKLISENLKKAKGEPYFVIKEFRKSIRGNT
jgi:hypothetical protein